MEKFRAVLNKMKKHAIKKNIEVVHKTLKARKLYLKINSAKKHEAHHTTEIEFNWRQTFLTEFA